MPLSIIFPLKNLHNYDKCHIFASSNQSIEGKVMNFSILSKENYQKTLVLGLIETGG